MARSSVAIFACTAADRPPSEIVGVVGDIRHGGLTTDPAPTVFLLHAQNPGYITSLVVRTAGDPTTFIGSIKAAVRDADRTQAVSDVKTMEQYVGDLLARPRLYAVMVASFALLALVIAAVGVYGLIAYVASQRTHEFGIRMALGAGPAAVFRSVFSHGTILAGAGLAIGLALSCGAAATDIDDAVRCHCDRSDHLPYSRGGLRGPRARCHAHPCMARVARQPDNGPPVRVSMRAVKKLRLLVRSLLARSSGVHRSDSGASRRPSRLQNARAEARAYARCLTRPDV